MSGLAIGADAFDPSVLDAHLRLNIVVSSDGGEVHDVGTDLAAIKAHLVGSVRDSIAAAAPIAERRGITSWDSELGDIPKVVESTDLALDVQAYPTLLDVGESVSLRVVTTPELQERAMRGGVRRLLLLEAAPTRASVERLITNAGRLALGSADIGAATLVDDCIAAAVDQIMAEHGALPWSAAEFADLRAEVKAKASNRAGIALGGSVQVVAAAAGVNGHLARLRAPALDDSVTDANLHLGRLVRPGFVSVYGIDRLADIERYVRGIRYRLEHLAGNGQRDLVRIAEIVPLENRFATYVDRVPTGQMTAEAAETRWLLEELARPDVRSTDRHEVLGEHQEDQSASRRPRRLSVWKAARRLVWWSETRLCAMSPPIVCLGGTTFSKLSLESAPGFCLSEEARRSLASGHDPSIRTIGEHQWFENRTDMTPPNELPDRARAPIASREEHDCDSRRLFPASLRRSSDRYGDARAKPCYRIRRRCRRAEFSYSRHSCRSTCD